MATLTLTERVSVNGFSFEKATTYSASGVRTIEDTVANGQTDKQVNIGIDVSQVAFFMIYSDKAVTVETNSGSSPTNTLNLLAGVPHIWKGASDLYAFKLTGDVTTSIFITNASGATANITIVLIDDATV